MRIKIGHFKKFVKSRHYEDTSNCNSTDFKKIREMKVVICIRDSTKVLKAFISLSDLKSLDLVVDPTLSQGFGTETVSDLPGLAGADEALRFSSSLFTGTLETEFSSCSLSNFILAVTKTSFRFTPIGSERLALWVSVLSLPWIFSPVERLFRLDNELLILKKHKQIIEIQNVII